MCISQTSEFPCDFLNRNTYQERPPLQLKLLILAFLRKPLSEKIIFLKIILALFQPLESPSRVTKNHKTVIESVQIQKLLKSKRLVNSTIFGLKPRLKLEILGK